MEHQRFDDLIRTFAVRDTGRRSALRLVVGGALGLFGVLSAENAEAHNALTKCRKIEDKKKRAKCVKAAKKHNAKHKDEEPKPECNPPCPARQGCAQVTCVAGECVVRSEPVAAGETCRPAAGPCDLAGTCDGQSLDCPANQFRPSTHQCWQQNCTRSSEDPEGYSEFQAVHCTGSSATCPMSGERQSCGQYRCLNSTSCRTFCNHASHCLGSAWCFFESCRPKQGSGTTCWGLTPQQCESGHCVNETCCRSACPPPPNATSTCQGGTCGFTCNAGWGNCRQNNPADGCETNLLYDPDHCGGCFQECRPSPNATSTCQRGTCSLVCDAGWANCNGAQGDGCEAEILIDPDHCGGCNQVCRGMCGNFGQGTLECINGSCDCVINP